MKKIFVLVLALTIALCTTACGSAGQQTPAPSQAPALESEAEPTPPPPATEAEEIELVVFAAASMTETLEDVSKLYADVQPNIKLVFNFDSSGTLKTQIQEGAGCDVFISAGQKQMNQLDITSTNDDNTEDLDFVLGGTRLDLLENRVTLVVPEGNPKDIGGFDDLADKLQKGEILMAMGNSDVPVGQYTQKILAYYDLNKESLANAGTVTYGSNVKEVTTQASEASVDCGVVYCTDAFSAKLDVVDYATADMCGRVVYPAAVLNISENIDAAKDFLSFLTTDAAMSVFENVGFSKP